jgi:endonuclease YncB( thermonuclease family)
VHGIGAPAQHHPFWCRGQQILCGTMSLVAFETLIAALKVRCEVVGRDRLVANVFFAQWVDIGRRLVYAGWLLVDLLP